MTGRAAKWYGTTRYFDLDCILESTRACICALHVRNTTYAPIIFLAVDHYSVAFPWDKQHRSPLLMAIHIHARLHLYYPNHCQFVNRYYSPFEAHLAVLPDCSTVSTLDKIRNVWTQYFPLSPAFTEFSLPSGSQTDRTFIVTGGNDGLVHWSNRVCGRPVNGNFSKYCNLFFLIRQRRSALFTALFASAESRNRSEVYPGSRKPPSLQTETGELKVLLIDLHDLPSVKDAAGTFAR